MRRFMGTAIAAFMTISLAACDQTPTGMDVSGDGAVVVGQVQSESASMQAAPANSTSESANVSGSAQTVVIGEFRSTGQFTALAEAQVDANGNFRIEGVPADRRELVIMARNSAGAEVGRVVLHEETRARTEHRAPPMNARSTLHGRVWGQMKANGQSQMGSAELALFLDLRSDAATSASADAAAIARLATGAARAEAAITAILAREGTPMSASARNALLLALAVERDRARSTGASAEASQRSYVEGSVAALAQGGISLEALTLAYAAAATAMANEASDSGDAVRTEAVRSALLLNLEARKRLVASVQGGGLGLKSEAQSHVSALEVRVRGAATWAELSGAVHAEQAGMEDRIAGGIAVALQVLSPQARLQAEAALEAALESARFWTYLNGSDSASAMADGAAAFRAEVTSRAQAAIEAIPANVRGSLTAQAMVSLLFGTGGCASL